LLPPLYIGVRVSFFCIHNRSLVFPLNIGAPLLKKIFGMLNEDIKDFAEVRE